MLLLTGKIHNTFTTEERTTKAGDAYGGDDKVQLMVSRRLDNGSQKDELVDLKVSSAKDFAQRVGHSVQIPVGVFSPAKGQVIFFMNGKAVYPKASA